MHAEQANKSDLAAGADGAGSQYLTFLLAGEEYGVDILRVQEIRGWDTVTSIPGTPEYLRGVMNLRGAIVPIVDLRLRFALEPQAYGPTTVVIVLRIVDESGEHTLGLVVDAVSEVYNVAADEFKPTPDLGGVIDAEFVKGLATVDAKMVILLEVDRLVNAGMLAKAGAAPCAAVA